MSDKDKRGNSQSAGQGRLLAHISDPKDGHAFKLQAPYKPTGDQPQAIAELVEASGRAINSRLY